ncbi:MAG: autotransporter [Solirubrobacteraceae bacterium]
MRVPALASCTALALVLLAPPPPAPGSTQIRRAQAARTLNGYDNGHLHYVRGSGSTLFEEGSASGALPGTMRAWLTVGATFAGRVTLYTRYGQIRANGSAKPSGAGRYQSFAGTLVITGGTGRYTHAHGRGGLYGSFDRRTYNLTIQTRGQFAY